MTSAGPCERGFTLVEMLVAMLLLSTIALAVTTTLVSAQQARARSERWMQASQLATEGLERLRAGGAAVPPAPAGYQRTASVALWNGHAGLYRLEVTVSWDDGSTHRVQFVTLARR